MGIATVEFFNASKGLGSIQPENSRKGVFVHMSAVSGAGTDTLQEGRCLQDAVVMDLAEAGSRETAGYVRTKL